MNVLFLTLVRFNSLQERNIYTDLLREFVKNGHQIYVISPVERTQNNETHIKTHIIREQNTTILSLQIGETQKTSSIKKGINTVLLEARFKYAIKKYFSKVTFDLILYSTPPITLVGAVEYVKKRDNAKTYLLLKDIFPQNAVDIEMMKTTGVRGILYRYFRLKEKQLYALSDRIGCMSQANVDYLIRHNPEIDPSIVEICPNSIEVFDKSIDEKTRKRIRLSYGIPENKTVFVYGGNLGKPQGIPFMIQCLKECEEIDNCLFLIVGDGTEYHLISEYIEQYHPKNVRLMKRLPKEDYDAMVGACDVGLIFLDHRFTIPNFPSRLLSYMQAKLPVLACTDSSTDVGRTIAEGGFGWWCESDDANAFVKTINAVPSNVRNFGQNAWDYLVSYYSTEESYKTIVKVIN